MNWDSVAEEYHERVGDSGDYYHNNFVNPVILELLGDIKNCEVVDFACGNGYFSRILAKLGASVIAVDVSEKLIEIAKRENSDPAIRFLVGDITALKSIEDYSQDWIVSTMALHLIEDLDPCMAEFSRLLKPRGKLIFAIPHPMRDLSTTQVDETGYYRKVKKYGQIATMPNGLYGDKGIIMYHRPLDYYFAKLKSSRFVVTTLREIKTIPPVEEKREKDYIDFQQEIPSFLVIEAMKAGSV
ncbi:MAG: class I SAM-dependent methyltransferase [Patescibacteria group bacterium]